LSKRLCFLITVVCMFLLVSIANGATTLMEIGRSPFHQPPLTSSDELISMVQTKQSEVKKGFDLAGRADLFESFMEQLTTVQIDKVDFQKGSKFEWMFYKKKGKGTVKVVKDVTWGNDKPFPGFKFDIDKDGNRYAFAVPLGCGNVALIGVSKVPVVVVAPPPKTPEPPKCAMKVAPTSALCGEMITVDASGSSAPDSDITKMSISFVDGQGNVVSEKVVDGSTLVGDVAIPCGDNALKVTITDSNGVDATSQECTTSVTGISKVSFVADVGYYHQIDPAHHLFGRVGLEYKFNEEFSVLGLIGGAPHIDGIDGKSAFIADLLGEYSFSRYFIDFGVGAWLTDGDDDIEAENSQMDLIAGFGARIYGEPDAFNTSLFLEVRSAPDELSDLMDYGRFGIGLRFRF